MIKYKEVEDMNTTEQDYQHFLSYSGLRDMALLRYAYFHGAGESCEKPAPQDADGGMCKHGVRLDWNCNACSNDTEKARLFIRG